MTQHIGTPAAQDPNISKEIRAFLKALNSGDGTPLEQMEPKEARLVLVNAQKSVDYDYSNIEESEKTISQDGQTIHLHIVKPKGAKENCRYLCFSMAVAGYWATTPLTKD